MQTNDRQHRSILQKIAHKAMLQRGLLPDFSTEALDELGRLQSPASTNSEQVRDLRDLLWASNPSVENPTRRSPIPPEKRPGNRQFFIIASDWHTFTYPV